MRGMVLTFSFPAFSMEQSPFVTSTCSYVGGAVHPIRHWKSGLTARTRQAATEQHTCVSSLLPQLIRLHARCMLCVPNRQHVQSPTVNSGATGLSGSLDSLDFT